MSILHACSHVRCHTNYDVIKFETCSILNTPLYLFCKLAMNGRKIRLADPTSNRVTAGRTCYI